MSRHFTVIYMLPDITCAVAVSRQMLPRIAVIVSVAAANAIALEQSQRSVSYATSELAYDMIAAIKIVPSTLTDAISTILSSHVTTVEYSWERGTFRSAAQPVLKRIEDIVVEKPPAAYYGGEPRGGSTPSSITTNLASLPTDNSTPSNSAIPSGIAIDYSSYFSVPKVTSFSSDTSTPLGLPASRSVASAAPAQSASSRHA